MTLLVVSTVVSVHSSAARLAHVSRLLSLPRQGTQSQGVALCSSLGSADQAIGQGQVLLPNHKPTSIYAVGGALDPCIDSCQGVILWGSGPKRSLWDGLLKAEQEWSQSCSQDASLLWAFTISFSTTRLLEGTVPSFLLHRTQRDDSCFLQDPCQYRPAARGVCVWQALGLFMCEECVSL